MPFDCLPDSAVSDLIKLRIARDGLAGPDGWRSAELGLRDEAQHCAIGWLLTATEWNEREATRLITKYVYPALPKVPRGETRISAVYRFNDKHNKAAVVKLFNDAIRLAETV